MGYRHTFVSTLRSVKLPEWFSEKYPSLYINDTIIATTTEVKLYGGFREVFNDYQKALLESGLFDTWNYPIRIAILSEGGVINRADITKGGVKYYMMNQGEELEFPTIDDIYIS